MQTAEHAPEQTHAEWATNKGWSGRGTLAQLVEELERQKDATVDFVTDTRNLGVRCDGDGGAYLVPAGGDASEFILEDTPINPSALAQIGERVSPNIPVRFLRKLVAERPERAERLITDLLHDTASTNLVRILDGRVRAFLSDRYQPLDNYTLAFGAMDVAKQHGGEVIECSLSDNAMRIKMTTRSIFDAIEGAREGGGNWYVGGLGNKEHLNRVAANTRGDLPGGPGTVHPLVTIGNSETGHGALNVRMGVLRAVCFNLATVETVVSNVHLGARLDPGIFSRDTIRKEAEATMAKASDSIATAFNEERFAKIVAVCSGAQSVRVDPSKAVDMAVAGDAIPKEKRDELLAHFLGQQVDHTAYGMAQAVARLAQDEDNPEAASDYEDFAGKIIAQPSLVEC